MTTKQLVNKDEGKLAILELVKARFPELKLSKDTGYFSTEVDISVSHPATVRVYFNVIGGLFVQYTNTSVLSATVSMGPKRIKVMMENLEDLLFDSTLFLNGYESENGYGYGRHSISTEQRSSVSRAKFVEVIKKDSLTLLFEQFDDNHHLQRAAYLGDSTVYIQDTLESEELTKAFTDKNWDVFFSLCDELKAIDEEGKFYQQLPVKDAETIRLFTVSKDKEHIEISLNNGKSLNELKAILVSQNVENPLVSAYLNLLPLQIGSFTVHSTSLVGEDIPQFEGGQWVKISSVEEGDPDWWLGMHGVVDSQKGLDVKILWENQYFPKESAHKISEYMNVNNIEKVADPTIHLEEPQFVMFELDLPKTETVRGFGWKVEETPNYAKVHIKGTLKNNILARVANVSLKHGRDKFKQFGESTAAVHGSFDFVLVPKEQIELVKTEFIGHIERFLVNKESESYVFETFMNLMKVADVSFINRKTFSILLMQLSNQKGFEKTVCDLTLEIANLKGKKDSARDPFRKENKLFKWINEQLK